VTRRCSTSFAATVWGPEPDAAAATASYERALGSLWLRRQPQLRAAVRLYRSPTSGATRLQTLRGIHATFTEGQSTPDLREAAELLA
jgi:hypothetical protein